MIEPDEKVCCFTARKLVNSEYSNLVGSSLFNVVVGTETPAVKLTYGITDGGELDADGEVNGTIVDPVGLGSSGTLPATGENSLTNIWFALMLMFVGSAIVVMERRLRWMKLT